MPKASSYRGLEGGERSPAEPRLPKLPTESALGRLGTGGGPPFGVWCRLLSRLLRDSSELWMKWQRGPYGQNPVVWNVRHSSVLYLGCRASVLSSWIPCAN